MKPKDTFQSRLENALKIRNIKPIELHKKTEISESLLSKYLSGNAIARQQKLTLLANALNVNEVWLMGYDVPMEKEINVNNLESPVQQVSLLGVANTSYNCLVQESLIDTVDINKKLKKTGEFFALKIKDDSMLPALMENDIVIIKKQEDFENGNIVVALINGDEVTIRKGRKSGDSILLQPLNSNYEPLIFSKKEMKTIPVKIIGIVKELKREF